MEVTIKPSPEISECPPISLGTQARARWGADTGYDHSAEAATPSSNRYALFDCMIDETGTYLSEDYSFCRRWTAMGGDIWADLASSLNHVGPYVFRGDFSSQFAPIQGQSTAG